MMRNMLWSDEVQSQVWIKATQKNQRQPPHCLYDNYQKLAEVRPGVNSLIYISWTIEEPPPPKTVIREMVWGGEGCTWVVTLFINKTWWTAWCHYPCCESLWDWTKWVKHCSMKPQVNIKSWMVSEAIKYFLIQKILEVMGYTIYDRVW